MKTYSITRFVAAGFIAASVAMQAQPVDRAEIEALRAQVQQLEQQLKVLSRQLELKEEAAAAAKPAVPKISVTDKGFTLASSDGANSIKLRGLVQADSRLFLDDAGGLVNSAFVLRRARIITEGTFARNFGFQIVPEFGGSSVSIVDANISVALGSGAQLKFGRFKVPVGLELLQSDSWTFFNERSLATNLVPNRDLGIQLSGDLGGGRFSYAVGIFNGVPDAGSSSNTDFDEDKDLAARLFAAPFKDDAGSSLQGLAFGLGASVGRQKTASGRASSYRTDGQQTFFSYLPTVVADGATWRISPQFDYRNGAFGLLGEYVLSTVNLRPTAGTPKAELQHRGWQVAGGYVLTGEDSSPNGVVPKSNFDWAAGTWGAFEVAARFAQLSIDEAAFPAFAAPGGSATEAASFGVGLNWYLSKAVRFTFDYYHTDFDLHALAPVTPTSAVLRQDEQAVITRLQVAF